MSERGITEEQRRAIEALAPHLESETYLAGGVAVAIELQHRTSLDIGLFIPREFDADQLAERLSATMRDVTIVSRAPGTVYLEMAGVPVSILTYRYPLVSPLRWSAGIGLPMAALEDLAWVRLLSNGVEVTHG